MRIAAILLFTLLLGSCRHLDPSQEPDLSKKYIVSYGTSFGMCLGFCEKEVKVTSNTALFEKRQRRPEDKLIRCSQPLSSQTSDSLFSIIDWNEFIKLDSVYGCPDCADGGAEWIAIEKDGRKHKVTYEYNHSPEAVKKYLPFLKNRTQEFNDCQ